MGQHHWLRLRERKAVGTAINQHILSGAIGGAEAGVRG